MIAFSLWWLHIYRYWIFYLVAFAVAYFFFSFIAKQKILHKYPRLQYLFQHKLTDVFIICALGVLVWWRLGHIFIYDFVYYLYNPLQIFALQQGGMSFIWWMLGVTVSLFVYLRIQKLSWKELFLFFDFIVAIVPFGIMLWRIGNFLNQELYWTIVPSWFWSMWYGWFSLLHDLHIFHVYPKVDEFLRINTNFLSAFFEWFLLLLVMMRLVWKRTTTMVMKPWFLIGVFLLWYSVVRFLLEYLRQDSQFEFVSWLTKSQWFFVWFFLLGIMFLIKSLFTLWNKKIS